ncbi:hypothetical protein ACHAXT_001317 [Thalassiosira profunda]
MNRRRPFPRGAPGRDPRKALLSSRTQRPQNSTTPAAPPPARSSSARLGAMANVAAARSAPPDDDPWDPFSVTPTDVEDASGGSGSRDSIFSADEWPAPGDDASFGNGSGGFGGDSFGNGSGGFGGESFGESSWSSFRPVGSTGGAHDKQGRAVDWPSSPQLSPIAQHDSLAAETSAEMSMEADEMSPQRTPLRKNGFWGALDASDAAEGPNDGEEDAILVSLSPEEPRESDPVSPARRRARAIVQKRSPRRGLAFKESNGKAPSRRQREPLPAPPPSNKAGKRPLEPPAADPAEPDGVPAALGTPAQTKRSDRRQPVAPAPPRSPHYGKPPDIHSKRWAKLKSPEAPPSMTSTARPNARRSARPPSTAGSLDAWHRRQEQLQLRQGITKPGQRPGREPGSVATNHSVLTDEMSEAQLARRKGTQSPWQGQIAARQRQVLDQKKKPREVWSREEAPKLRNATANGADSVGGSADDDSGTWAMADVTLSSLEGGDPFRAGASPKRTLWEGGLPSRQSHEQAAEPTQPVDAAAPVEDAERRATRPECAPDEAEPPPPRGERTKQSVPQPRRVEEGRASNEIIGATRGLVMAGLADNAPPEAARTSPAQRAPPSTRGVYRRTHPAARALPTPPPHPSTRPAAATSTTTATNKMNGRSAVAKKPPLGPSPTSIADATVLRLPSGARQLASPARSDHSADAAAGATHFGAAGLRDVRRRIFKHGVVASANGTVGEGAPAGAAVAEKNGEGKAPTVRQVLRDDGADLDLRNVQAVYRSPDRREAQAIHARVSRDGARGGAAGGSPNRPRAAALFQPRAASPAGGVTRTVSWDDDSAPSSNLDAKLSKMMPSIGPARSFDSAVDSVRSNRSLGSRRRGRGGASVASAAPSVETACVRQNAEIARAMDDMMEFFMDAEASGGDGDGDGMGSGSIEGRGWGDGDHWEPAAPHSYFSGGPSPGPRRPLPEEEAPFDVAAARPAGGADPPTVTPLRSNRMTYGTGTAVTTISNLMLFPSPSEEYDDPSVFANSILSEASSELAVPPRGPPSRPTPAEAPSNRDSLGFPKGNHEPAEISGTGAKKDLSNFFDQFSDRLIHGCHDGEGESSDVFFVDNGWNAGHWGDQDPSNDRKADPAVSQTLQRARLDAADSPPALPPASTFLSPKDRAKIRQRDTTPLRGNTARSRRMAGAQRSHVSYPSVHSIQESAHEDDEEESREIVDDDQSSDYTACSGSEGSGDDASSGGASSGDGSSDEESGYGAQSSPASGDSPNLSRSTRESRSPLDSALDEPGSPPTPPALQRSLLEPFEEKKEDPPDRSFAERIDPDTMKMTHREKRKGHSLAWHSSNGVNDNELYDSKQLPPSRAQRASTIAGRLNLLTISSLTAGTFQEHFGDDDDSAHHPLYSLASDRAVTDESQLGSVLGSIQEESFEHLSEDDDESVEDGEEEESDYVQMLRDFKDIIQRAGKKAVGGESEEEDEDVRPKGQHRSPVTTPAADRAAGGYGPARRVPTPHQSAKAIPKPSRALASHPSPSYMPARYQMSHGSPAVQRKAPVRARGGVPPLHRQTRQNYHPHQVPRGQELTKSRLEEKLLGISGGVHRKHCGDSVATSELGSLLTRDSERNQIGNVGVPTMIFHRTHPGVRATDGVLAAKASPESCRSSPSSMQNTYNGSVAGLARTPKGNVSVPRNRIYLPEDMVDDPPVANHGQRPATASSPARQVNVNEAKANPPRNTKQEHYKAAAAAIAKIDEELRNSDRQKVPAFPSATARKSQTPSAPPKPPTGKPATNGSNMVGSGTKAVQIQVNRVRSEPKRVATRAPAEPLPNGPEMQRSRSAFVGSATAMKPRQMQTANKPVRQSNAVEVVGPPSLGKARSYGSKPAAQPVRKQRSMDPVIPHSLGTKQFGVQPVVTTRRDSNSNASTRALFLATSSSTLQAENLSSKQQPQIPASFNSSRSIRRNMVTPDNTSQHSSIFEAFEVAPLRTFSDDGDDQKDANAFLNYVGVHHSFTRKGSKRVGFPTPPGAVAHPIGNSYPLRSKNATAQRARSQSNSASKAEGFEVILPKRQPQPPPPPPVTPAAGSSHPQGNSQRNRMRQKMRAGWKRMVHPGTSSSNNGTAATARTNNKVGPRVTANTKRGGGQDPPGSLAG